MRSAIVTAALAAAACGPKSPTRPPQPEDIPATTWSTEVPPFRLPSRPSAMWVDDHHAVMTVGKGGIASVDLATGAVTTRYTPGVSADVAGIVAGPGGRLTVAVMPTDDHLTLYAVDAELAMTPFYVAPEPGWSHATIASAPDGHLALSGDNRPLTMYDADGTPGHTFFAYGAPDVDWEALMFAAGGKRLLGRHDGTLFSFELSSGGGVSGAAGEWVASGDGSTALALVDTALAAVDVTTAQVTFELARPGNGIAAMSRDGSMVARIDDDAVMLYDMAARRAIARYALGPSMTSSGMIEFTPAGDRVVLATGATVRVLDVATGVLSDPGPGPYGTPSFLTVTREYVIEGADQIRRWSVAGGAPELIGPDDLDLSEGAMSPSGTWFVTAHALPKANRDAPTELELATWTAAPAAAVAPIGRWNRNDSIASLAIDDDGVVMVGAWRGSEDVKPGHNVIDRGDKDGAWKRLLEVHYDGYVDAIDATTELAVVSSGGAVRVIQLPGIAPVASLDIPTCDSGGAVHLDARGHRISTDDDKTLWMWSFAADSPATLVGSAGFTGKIGDIAFVPGRSEVVVDLDDRIVVWDYVAGTAMATPVDAVIGRLAIDPAGSRIAAALNNGRLRVWKLDDLRHGRPEAITAGSAVQHCNRDPLEPPGDRPRPSQSPPFTAP